MVGGIVLVVAGAGLLAGGIAIQNKEINNDEWGDGEISLAGVPLIILGAAGVFTSIPVFIGGAVKKRKARAIVFANKGVSLTPHHLIPNTSHMGLKLVIPLGK